MSEEEKKKKQNEKEEKEQTSVDVDYEEKWKRALADYRNLQKRVAKGKQDLARFSNRELISKLLPILDDLEEAAKNSEDEGYEKILKKLKDVLREEGLEEIEVLGKEFDPEVMEGLEPQKVQKGEEKTQRQKEGNGNGETRPRKTRPDLSGRVEESGGPEDSAEDKKVVNKVVRKGYNLHGKLLRPARVCVE